MWSGAARVTRRFGSWATTTCAGCRSPRKISKLCRGITATTTAYWRERRARGSPVGCIVTTSVAAPVGRVWISGARVLMVGRVVLVIWRLVGRVPMGRRSLIWVRCVSRPSTSSTRMALGWILVRRVGMLRASTTLVIGAAPHLGTSLAVVFYA